MMPLAVHTAVVALVVGLLFGTAALCPSAARAAASVPPIVADAADGVVSGTYSAAAVRAALALVRGDPTYLQYSDIDGVLADYLASITATSSSGATNTSAPAAGSTSPTGSIAASDEMSDDQKEDGQTAPGASPSSESPDLMPGVAAATPDLEAPTSWGQVRSRLAATPWFFAAGATLLVVGIVVLRRQRSA